MGYEIEKKFLLKNDSWRGLGKRKDYRQGYLVCDKERTVRVRTKGSEGIITIKGVAIGGVRPEFEYGIPHTDANTLLKELCLQPIIEKTRTRIPMGNITWEIDEFAGENKGLILAEVELDKPDQFIILPEWIGREVTEEGRFYNANLVHYPYSMWTEEEKR